MQKKVSGKLNKWKSNVHLSLADEIGGGRPWLGEFHLVAIYRRALSVNEIQQNFQAGQSGDVTPMQVAQDQRELLFEQEIAPLLAQNCLECHDSASKKGGLDLSRKTAARAGGESGEVILPGKSQESLLWDQIESGDMPPSGEPLSDKDKAFVRKWIDGGAVWTVDQIDPAIYAQKKRPNNIWVQRLTVPEYIETVRSAVGVDIVQEAREILPPDLRADGFSNTAYNLHVDLKHVEAYAHLP